MIEIIIYIIMYIVTTIGLVRFLKIGKRYEATEKELSDKNIKKNNYNRMRDVSIKK